MTAKPKFLRPDDDGTWHEDKQDVDPDGQTLFIFNRHLSLVLEEQRKRLPIYKYRNHIIYLLEKYQTVVLLGETGCGKSTQVPQYLYEAGWCTDDKMIGITEPRRVGATTLAARVAEERSSSLGEAVGYSIRFDDCTSEQTRIKYMTEGLLIREMMADPLLRKYSVIMVDEVHERTLLTDILMGLLKKILKRRKTLHLIVASATVDAEKLRDFFNTNTTRDKSKDSSVIMSVEGRLYPVEIFYTTEPVSDYVKGLVETVIKIHESSDEQGDILGFLTGHQEVDSAIDMLSDYVTTSTNKVKLFPVAMYGSLTNSEQLKVFRSAPKGFRKVVVATNIAETSVTIPDILYVVDCGFVKMKFFRSDSYTESLCVVAESKAGAEQRAGRAGRLRRGKCFRLFTEESFEQMCDETPPEMLRADLSAAVLQMKALGVDNILRFSFPSPPPAKNLLAGVEVLHALAALDQEARLTRPLGLHMAEFPLPPLHAKSLLVSHEFGCSEEMASILSLVQVQNVWTLPRGGGAAIKARVARRQFEVEEGDLLTLLNVYRAWLAKAADLGVARRWAHTNFVNHKALLRATAIRNQMTGLLNQLDIPLSSANGDGVKIRRCVAAGFFSNAAYLHPSGVYKTTRGEVSLHVHPSSVLYTLKQPQWLVYCETVHTDRLYMRELTVVCPEWLHQLAPHFYHITNQRP